jgi:hypothetical protein
LPRLRREPYAAGFSPKSQSGSWSSRIWVEAVEKELLGQQSLAEKQKLG